MDPTSRNRVLMIGGALILIALLLVCGPLEGRFGGEREGTSEPPAVAAGPPEHALDAVDAAAAGALAGAALGENAGALTDAGVAEATDRPVVAGAEAGAGGASAGSPGPAPAVVAGVAAGAAGTGAAAEAADGGGGGGTPGSTTSPSASELPPVSAGVPLAPVAGAVAATTAASTFDEALSASPSQALGPAVDLFPPPVAGAAPLALASASQPFGLDSTLLRPCDDPGSGCRNIAAPAGPLVVQTPPPVFRGRIPRDQR